MTSKRFKKLPTDTSKLQSKAIENILTEVKKNCTTKFDESIDVSLSLRIFFASIKGHAFVLSKLALSITSFQKFTYLVVFINSYSVEIYLP